MKFIDTHTHLYVEEFGTDAIEAVHRAIAAGVEHLVMPNINVATVEPMHDLASVFPQNVSMALGLHPSDVTSGWNADLDMLFLDFAPEQYVAIGEIGIDLYWDKTYRDEQMLAFEKQVQVAVNYDIPIIIHCRDGLNETLEVLQGVAGARGVFHSFGGNADDVELIRKSVGDFYFGINGIVTFKNSRLREVLPEIGLNRILLETDSPYLAPVPHRGKRNESAYIPHIAAHIAQSLEVPVDEVAQATFDNAVKLFGLNYE